MEENWGFAKLYDKEYKHGYTPLFQTLLAIASGCTGYNVYTAVGTAHWDDNIDNGHEKPYPSDSPISEKGKLTNKFYLMAALNKYFGTYHGKEFFECSQDKLLSIGLYQPYIQLAAFAGEDPNVWKRLGYDQAPCFGMNGLALFHIAMRKLKLGYDLLNLEEKDFNPQNTPSLLFFVSKFLSKNVQEKLVKYIKDGGILYLIGELPTKSFEGGNFEDCEILRDFVADSPALISQISELKITKALEMKKEKGLVVFQKGNPYIQRKGPVHYAVKFLTKLLMKLRIKIPFRQTIDGALFPYSEVMGMIGGDTINPKLSSTVLSSLNKFMKFLEDHKLYRNIEVSVSTLEDMENNADVFVFQHPKKDIQHVFLFNLNEASVPIVVDYIASTFNRNVSIDTRIVDNTAQLFRIENGRLTSFIYTSFNPDRNVRRSLDVKINGIPTKTSVPVDLCVLKANEELEIITANGKLGESIELNGFSEEPIALNPKGIEKIRYKTKKLT